MEDSMRDPHPSTLFHLVPVNYEAHTQVARDFNSRFLSRSVYYDRPGHPSTKGLEVGYHLRGPGAPPSIETIATIGRHGDTLLEDSRISRIHVAFEMGQMPDTSVKLSALDPRKSRPQPLAIANGIARLTKGQTYHLWITTYEFHLVWTHKAQDAGILSSIAYRGYQAAKAKALTSEFWNQTTDPDPVAQVTGPRT
ncbi:hypothetical protein F5Y17DRAFT_455682 [Xylariaceae sp. FL0594]|nr:hypothetical protein F5Y17DRAFT_455682 [Xylariaceae sp. FL0594]